MQLNSKKLLILGGKPIASCDIVNYAKKIGVYTIVTDNLSDEESPAKQIADESWEISTADIDKLQSLVIQHKIDAVFTGAHEFNIRKTMELAKRCSLPFYASEEQMEITSIKSIYKKLFKKFDLPVVPEYQMDNMMNINYPVIVKPIDGSGGYGISICNTNEELKAGIEHAKSFSDRNEMLIEKYIRGKEVTIFYILQNGNILLSAMADRHTHYFSEGIIPLPVAYNFPSKYIDLFIKMQNEKTISALKSIGLNDGMLFIQAFFDEEQFVYYDIGYRLTGTQEYNILEEVNGYNPLKMMVDYALTGQMGAMDINDLVDPYFNGKFACNVTLLSKPGKIVRYVGIEEIKKYKGVVKTVINHEVGTTISKNAMGTLNQVVFRVFGIASTIKEVNALKDFVNNNFDVISDENLSLLIPLESDGCQI